MKPVLTDVYHLFRLTMLGLGMSPWCDCLDNCIFIFK